MASPAAAAIRAVRIATIPYLSASAQHSLYKVVFKIHYSDRIGENYFSKHAERHKWYFWSALTRDEAVLIKQWDSAGELARTNGANGDAAKTGLPSTFSFHTAFEDPATPPDAPDRWSIEVRCVAIYD